jgi:hypothetical protein
MFLQIVWKYLPVPPIVIWDLIALLVAITLYYAF